MPRLPIATLILIALAPAATAARADDQNIADVRCVVIAMGMAQSPDPHMRALATTSGLYFIGRLQGRAPDLDLTTVIVDQVKAMGPEDIQREARRCGTVMVSQSARLTAIGAGLQTAARDAPGPAMNAAK